jgi:hypothetical protein
MHLFLTTATLLKPTPSGVARVTELVGQIIIIIYQFLTGKFDPNAML